MCVEAFCSCRICTRKAMGIYCKIATGKAPRLPLPLQAHNTKSLLGATLDAPLTSYLLGLEILQTLNCADLEVLPLLSLIVRHVPNLIGPPQRHFNGKKPSGAGAASRSLAKCQGWSGSLNWTLLRRAGFVLKLLAGS